jgi:hypothetical protein
MERPVASACTLLALLGVAGCDRLFGGDLGHDPDAATARMHKIPDLFPTGELKTEAV